MQVCKMKKKLYPMHLELIVEVLCKKFELLANSISRNLYSQPCLINSIIADIKEPWNDLTLNKQESVMQLDHYYRKKTFDSQPDHETECLLYEKIDSLVARTKDVEMVSNQVTEMLKLDDISFINFDQRIIENFRPQHDI